MLEEGHIMVDAHIALVRKLVNVSCVMRSICCSPMKQHYVLIMRN